MITRQEAKQIVDFVISELKRRQFGYITDGKMDFTKTTIGLITGGTSTSGGQISDEAIFDRHVNPAADIRGTKVRYATLVEGGVQTLAYKQQELNSLLPGSGASLIGVADASGVFIGTNVEDVLYELFLAVGAVTFIALTDTPDGYTNPWSMIGRVPVINKIENGLEFKPVSYIDGGAFTDTYEGAKDTHHSPVDGGSFTGNEIVDGGTF